MNKTHCIFGINKQLAVNASFVDTILQTRRRVYPQLTQTARIL